MSAIPTFKPISSIFHNNNLLYLIVGHTVSGKTTLCIDIIYHYASICSKIYYFTNEYRYQKINILNNDKLILLEPIFENIYMIWKECKIQDKNKSKQLKNNKILIVIDDINSEIDFLRTSHKKVSYINKNGNETKISTYKAINSLLQDIYDIANNNDNILLIISDLDYTLYNKILNPKNIIICDDKLISIIQTLKKFRTTDMRKLITKQSYKIFCKYPYYVLLINGDNIFTTKADTHYDIIKYDW